MLLIKNGRMIDPGDAGADAPRDILLDGDRIAAIAPHGDNSAREPRMVRRYFDATEFNRRSGLHRFALPSSRTWRRVFGNHRNGHASGGARRIHSCLSDAEYATQ